MAFATRATAVVGVGYSTIHRETGVDSRPLAVTAAKQAIGDAGLTTADIDGIFEYPGQGTQIAVEMQRMLGIRDLAVFGDNSASGPSGLAAAQNAVMAVASGACETALVFRSVTREWGQQSGKSEFPPADGPAQFLAPYGDYGAVIPSMGMRKYRRFVDFGGSEEDYGHIAVNARRWSALNDRAVLRTPITMDDYLSSRYIAEPLRLFDCDYPVTGACATVITSTERAADLRRKPVVVDAMAQGTGSRPSWSFADDLVFGGTIDCGNRLWERSSVTPQDVKVAELYDGFTHITISWVEALGLCGLGEFGDWVDGGRTIGPGGRLPLNTNGGQLAEGRLHGLSFLNEAVLQLRDECGDRQVAGADVAVVANAHGPQCGAMVLTS
ncbi:MULTISPECIES: thiolase family protein [Streptomyces]|uniref:Thiolase family protein n=1 Tax=Streptomyces prunicolor TaxID=67348 RepID=A0ABU4FBV0_9ACTN|nr:thiolase family protein [Streptomyces prunicolor]MCX5240373.1 thiolase family protein [Streptomyces prunicolor]MDV7218072.1 thiolase family protein [Streptomyces prunicolor]WSX16781.1 thiolase family protein [Streptomyces sp. NBC_00988]